MIRKVKICGYRTHRELAVEPNAKINLIVGPNEAGKSTFLEAIVLALTGRINGRSISEELNPYWFNSSLVAEFVAQRRAGVPASFPEISIEITFENNSELQPLCGAVNSHEPTLVCPGVTVRIFPDPECAADLEEWAKSPSELIPVEFYRYEWRSFADDQLVKRPKALAAVIINAHNVRTSSGVDYHLRQILNEHLDPLERAQISLEYRRIKSSMSDTALNAVNERISSTHAALHNRPITLAMDQSSRTSWEAVVAPHVDSIPFGLVGLGQQAAIKIALAMSRHASTARFVLIEEPENHLTHTSLGALLSKIESLAGEDQQLFITTHSSFVLNRLGLDALLLMGKNNAIKLTTLAPDTVGYFKKLPGYDTLRIVLADSIVLVEGPSDEIVFERVFRDEYGKWPMECGVDVLSMRGLSLARGLEICAALDKPVVVVRDNDGNEPDELREALRPWLEDGKRELFVGEVAHGETLEPQLLFHNGEASLREILGLSGRADVRRWMKREKTEAALRISASEKKIVPPPYLLQAVKSAHG